MNCERTLIAAVVLLGLGIGLIFGYCHDSTVSFSAAHPVAGTALKIAINTDGLPALAGLAMTVGGLLFLFAALVLAVLKMLSDHETPSRQSAPAA